MPFMLTISMERISFCTETQLTKFVKRLNLHIAFFGEIYIREVDMVCTQEENNSGYQKEKVRKNEHWPKIPVKNLDFKKICCM